MTYHPKYSETLSKLTGVSEKSGDVGVELEIEGNNLPKEIPGWIVKSELSLRGENGRRCDEGEDLPDTPREYITRGPAKFMSLANKLVNLHNELTKQHVKVRLTPRASTHIHLNMGAETLKTLFAFLLTFVAVEPVLLRLCGNLRNGNLFCLPTYETGDLDIFLSKLAAKIHYGGSPPRGKYASLNLDPLGTQGSVEVRCFPNTVTPSDVTKWAGWLLNIREIARGADDRLTGLLDRMYQNPRMLLTSVFGSENTGAACAPQFPNELTLYGVEQAYELWRAMLPFLDYEEPKDLVKTKKGFKEVYVDYMQQLSSLDDLGPGTPAPSPYPTLHPTAGPEEWHD